jgi:hypothetical protein
LLQSAQGKNDGTNFHTVVGSELFTTMNVFLMAARAQYRAPTTWARIAFACSIGVDDDVR